MAETVERVGKFDMRVEFAEPAEPGDYRQRRIDALAAWLLERWEAEQTEMEHGTARAAG